MTSFDVRLRVARQVARLLQHYDGALDALGSKIKETNDSPITIDVLPAPPDVAIAVYSVMVDAQLLERIGNDPLEGPGERLYCVRDTISTARTIDDARIICALTLDKQDADILRTWPFADPLPGYLARQTHDLDLCYKNLLASATEHAFVVTPFLNISAAERLLSAVEHAIQSGASVDLITYLAHQAGSARSAIEYIQQRLQARFGRTKAEQFTAYSNVQPEIMIHAKLLLIDARTGYLGSANTTSQGFANHLEVGVELNAAQTKLLGSIIQHVINQGHVVPVTFRS